MPEINYSYVTCGLGSRIRDMEAEWRLRVINDLIFGESGMNRTLSLCQDMMFLASNSLHNLGGQK